MVFRPIFPTYHETWWPPHRLFDSFDDDPRALTSLVTADAAHRDRTTSSSVTVKPSYRYRRAKNDAYLEVELPGVAREDVSVAVESRKLIIKGKRYQRQDGLCVCREVLRKECKEGHTDRVVDVRYLLALRLGERADLDTVRADCCGDGLLVVHVPAKDSGSRKIELGA